MTKSHPPPLPGDLTPRQALERAIRVDHAGEFGAVRIYAGQLALMRHGPAKDKVRKMAEQEAHHLETFEKLIAERRVRPTGLTSVWHVAGWALGAATAAMGAKAAMACTVAVEAVIDEHYRGQTRQLAKAEPALCEIIEEFRAEELEHKQMALDEGAEEAPGYLLMRFGIGAGSRMAIWLSERF